MLAREANNRRQGRTIKRGRRWDGSGLEEVLQKGDLVLEWNVWVIG